MFFGFFCRFRAVRARFVEVPTTPRKSPLGRRVAAQTAAQTFGHFPGVIRPGLGRGRRRNLQRWQPPHRRRLVDKFDMAVGVRREYGR